MTQPLSFLNDLLCIESVVWDIQRNDELSGTGDGRIWQAELAPPLWTALITVNVNYHQEIKKIAARIRALKGSKEPFMLVDPLSKKFANITNGSIATSTFNYNTLSRLYTREGATVTEGSSIAVSRTGSASYFNESGNLVTTGGNTLRFDNDPTSVNLTWPSENLSATQWNATRLTPTLANVWNGMQFTRLTPNTATQVSHQITNNRTFAAVPFGRECMHSMIVKSDGPTTTRLALRCWDTQGFIGFVYYNLEAGTSFPTSLITTTIDSLGDGYWRITATHAIREGSTTGGNQIYAANPTGNSTTNYDFNGVDGYLVSACQFEISSYPITSFSGYKKTTTVPAAKPLGLLIEPSATNLCLQSGNMMNSPWIAALGVVRQTSTVLAPDGVTNAVAIGPGTTSGQQYLSQQSIGTFPGQGNKYSQKVFGRFGGWRYFQFWWPGGATGVSGQWVNIDLQQGVATSTSANNVSVSVKQLPNGWFLFETIVTVEGDGTAGGTSGLPTINIAPINSMSDGRRPTVVGDGNTVSYFWGAQHEISDTPSSYIPTTTVAVTRGNEIANVNFGIGGNWTYKVNNGANQTVTGTSTNLNFTSGYITSIVGMGTNVTRTFSLSSISSDGNTVSISGLPAGFVLESGDKFQVNYGTDRVSFHEISFDYTANSSGVASGVNILPNIPTGVLVGAPIIVENAACKMIIYPDSFNPGTAAGLFTTGLTFKAIQKK